MSQADFTKLLLDLSAMIGVQDPRIVLLISLGLFLFLMLVAFSLRAARHRTFSLQRVDALREKVTDLEANLNKFRTEISQKIDEFKVLVAALKKDSPATKTVSAPKQGETLSAFSVPKEVLADKKESLPSQTLREGLKQTREGFFGKIKRFFQDRKTVDESALYELEELLLSSDVGVSCTSRLISRVKEKVSEGSSVTQDKLIEVLRSEIESVMAILPSEERDVLKAGVVNSPRVIMVVGVNGVGKTTSAAKLAAAAKSQGRKPLLVAGDTFRAAAVEQLKMWGERLDVPVVSGPPDAKPGTVVFDGIEQAIKLGRDLILIDTAGRLHNKTNLMQELQGIKNVMTKRLPDAPDETLLVLDGISGNNALVQAREFNAIVPLTGVIVTKLDGTPKGGIVVAIRDELKLPVRYIGVGEQAADLTKFDSANFVDSLLT